MRLLSVNRSLPKPVEWQGKTISTGIFKSPAAGSVPIDFKGLDGDGQGDLSVHGGVDKAVYAFPYEHYQYFAQLLDRNTEDFLYGQFGENLTTEGLFETEVLIGDRFRIGDFAEFEVTQPRVPCFKLGIIMQSPQIIRPFLKSLKTGFYLRVIKQGTIQAGDRIYKTECSKESLSVADITRLYHFDKNHHDEIRKAAAIPSLTQSWRDDFHRMLSSGT